MSVTTYLKGIGSFNAAVTIANQDFMINRRAETGNAAGMTPFCNSLFCCNSIYLPRTAREKTDKHDFLTEELQRKLLERIDSLFQKQKSRMSGDEVFKIRCATIHWERSSKMLEEVF